MEMSENDRGDTLELSVQAREVQDFRVALRDIGEVRQDKVEQLKKEVQGGTYRADARRIAEGIIQDRLLDRQV